MSTQHDLWPMPPSKEGFTKLLEDFQEQRRKDARQRFRDGARSVLVVCAVVGVALAAWAAFFLFAVTIGTL